MNIRFSLFVAAVMTFCTVPQAHAAYAMMGYGSHDCVQFTKDMQNDPQHVRETIYFSWAQGFMSAENWLLIQDGKQTRDLSSNPVAQQEIFIRDFCAAHPDSGYGDAVQTLFESLTINPDKPK